MFHGTSSDAQEQKIQSNPDKKADIICENRMRMFLINVEKEITLRGHNNLDIGRVTIDTRLNVTAFNGWDRL